MLPIKKNFIKHLTNKIVHTSTDVPYKRKVKTFVYDPKGELIRKTTSTRVGSVWNMNYGYFKYRTIIDSNEYRITELFHGIKGVIVKQQRTVKRKKQFSVNASIRNSKQ